jgi:hypothetical protein
MGLEGMTFIQYVGSIGGVAGVLAVLIFWAYKNANIQAREDRKFMEDRLSLIIKADQESREKNTQVLTELITWLKMKNGHK